MEEAIVLENSKGKLRVIWDTHIYDKLADRKISSDLVKNSLKSIDYYITHIQMDEINNCLEKSRHKNLQAAVSLIKPVALESKKPRDENLLHKLKQGRDKHLHDALIGEAAISRNMILVTEDKKLRRKINESRGCAMSLRDL